MLCLLALCALLPVTAEAQQHKKLFKAIGNNHSVDSIVIYKMRNNVFFASNVTRESFLGFSDLIAKQKVVEVREKQAFMNEILTCEIDSTMPYSANQVQKDALGFIAHTKVGESSPEILWIDKSDDYRGLAIIFQNGHFNLIWFSLGYVYVDKYRCKTTERIRQFMLADSVASIIETSPITK